MIEMKARKQGKNEGRLKQPAPKILKPNQKAEHFKKEINKSMLFDGNWIFFIYLSIN